ncbi:MAG: VanZ family protein [Candidatus Cloacimonas sp.]|jgi:VanZ family protein|nr:VanZ family protein [Candidatus Cloacimonas sp.]
MKFVRTIYPGIIWMVVIWIISSIPSSNLPSVKIFGFDKLAHLVIYAILGVSFSPWLKQIAQQHNWLKFQEGLLFFGLLVILAAADESHQRFIPGRTVSIYDFLANSTGLGLGYLVHRLI